MAVVVDASVAVAWCFPDEEEPAGLDALALGFVRETVIVPGMFWYEVRNALLRAERRGRIDREGSGRFLRQLATLRTELDFRHNEAETLALARRHTLTFYDAAYLETAKRRGVALATLDSALASAAAVEGVANPLS